MKKLCRIILAAAGLAALAALAVFLGRQTKNRERSAEIVSIIVKNREKIAELVTYRYSRDTVVFETQEPSGILSYFSSEPDTVAIFLVRPTICAGVDLMALSEESFAIRNDTLYVQLPAPKILSLYLNHSDIVPVYDSRRWDMDAKMSVLAEKAKSDFQRDALRQGILAKAGDKAEREMSEFLSLLCGMPVVASCATAAVTMPLMD